MKLFFLKIGLGVIFCQNLMAGSLINFNALNEAMMQFGFVQNSVGQILYNVEQIRWGNGGEYYWVIFQDHSARLFNNKMNSFAGMVLQNVQQIRWSRADYYWVIFQDGSARMYKLATEPVGFILQNVDQIRWSSLGDRYWVIFKDQTAQMYSVVQGPAGAKLSNVLEIDWSNNGSQYSVIFLDGSCKQYRFYNPGRSILKLLSNLRLIRSASAV